MRSAEAGLMWGGWREREGRRQAVCVCVFVAGKNKDLRNSCHNEVEGILVTFVTCNYRNKYQKLQLGSGFKPTNN